MSAARRTRRLVAAGLGLALALAGAARPPGAGAAVRSEVDARKIGLDDQLQLTITVEETASLPDDVALPALTNLRVVGGPAVSTQMSFVNGRMSQGRSWTYALQPLAAGPAEVGAVRVRIGNEERTAPAIPIEVVAGSVKPRAPARRRLDPFGDPFFDDPFSGRGRERAEARLFVEARASRTSLHVGEPLLLTYFLYTQTSVSELQFAEAPQFTGFWVEDLPRPERADGEPVTVEGLAYRRFPVFSKLLFPTRAGRLTLPAVTLRIGIPPQSFFGGGAVVERATKPLAVEVKPIPDDPGFSGAVGRYQATAAVDRSTLPLGEAATLRFKVEGSGNLKWIDRAPEVEVPGAKVFPPQTKSDLRAGPAGIVGSRTWEFVVVPQTAGTLEIPSLAFSYFDPAAGRIARSETAAIPLRVEPGAPGAALPAPAIGSAAPGGPPALRDELERRPAGAAALPGRTVGLLAALVVLLHAGLWGADRIPLSRAGGAGRAAPRRGVRGALRELERVARGGMTKEKAAGQIEKTVHAVFGSLDGDESERGRAVRQLLDEVHLVRYAPQLGDYSERLRELVAHASHVVRRWA